MSLKKSTLCHSKNPTRMINSHNRLEEKYF